MMSEEIKIDERLKDYIKAIAKNDQTLIDNIIIVYEAGYIKGEKAGVKWAKDMTNKLITEAFK